MVGDKSKGPSVSEDCRIRSLGQLRWYCSIYCGKQRTMHSHSQCYFLNFGSYDDTAASTVACNGTGTATLSVILSLLAVTMVHQHILWHATDHALPLSVSLSQFQRYNHWSLTYFCTHMQKNMLIVWQLRWYCSVCTVAFNGPCTATVNVSFSISTL